ncbi:MAG: type II 3-dehydroquinate dehydratase [Thermovirgaceae bacterium]
MERRLAFAVLNGPNLNLLGEREPGVYGKHSLSDLENLCRKWADDHNAAVEFFQSNHEGELIDRLQVLHKSVSGVVFNPGGYTHTSVALRDCVAAVAVPVVEVHLSNPAAREPFRHTSLIAPVAAGSIAGFGVRGYILALESFLGSAY